MPGHEIREYTTAVTNDLQGTNGVCLAKSTCMGEDAQATTFMTTLLPGAV